MSTPVIPDSPEPAPADPQAAQQQDGTEAGEAATDAIPAIVRPYLALAAQAAATTPEAPVTLPPAPDVTLEHPYAVWETLGRVPFPPCSGCGAEFTDEHAADAPDIFDRLWRSAVDAGWRMTVMHGLLCPACRMKARTADPAAQDETAAQEPQADHRDQFLAARAEMKARDAEFWTDLNRRNSTEQAKVHMGLEDGWYRIRGAFTGHPEFRTDEHTAAGWASAEAGLALLKDQMHREALERLAVIRGEDQAPRHATSVADGGAR